MRARHLNQCRPRDHIPLGRRWLFLGLRSHRKFLTMLRVFADEDAAEAWFGENDAEGVAFEYSVKAVRREGLV